MKIYPYEDETFYGIGSKTLGLTQRARATALLKDYNLDADDIEGDKLRKSAQSRNEDVCRKLAFFNIITIVDNKKEIDISHYTPIDVDKADREERDARLASEEAGDFDYRDQLNLW